MSLLWKPAPISAASGSAGTRLNAPPLPPPPLSVPLDCFGLKVTTSDSLIKTRTSRVPWGFSPADFWRGSAWSGGGEGLSAEKPGKSVLTHSHAEEQLPFDEARGTAGLAGRC